MTLIVLPLLNFGEISLSLPRYVVAVPAELLVPVCVLLFPLEHHEPALWSCSFGDEDDRVVARVGEPVLHEELAETLHLERILRDDAAVRGAGHRGQQRGEPGVAAEDLDDEEPLVRAGRGAQAVGHLDRPRHARAEPDAVVGPRHVVVHRLGDRDDLDALLVQADPVAERVVAADRDDVVDAEVLEVLEHLAGQVVDLVAVLVLEMCRARSSAETWLGRVRELCRNVPPVRPILLTIVSVSNS